MEDVAIVAVSLYAVCAACFIYVGFTISHKLSREQPNEVVGLSEEAAAEDHSL